MVPAKLVKQVKAQWVTQKSFQPYGQVIYATQDDKPCDSTDAVLVLHKGIPRFYIMRLHHKGCKFHMITRHVLCTQCLGSLGGREWLIAVTCPTNTSRPIVEEIVAFRIPGNCFIKLDVGTWHAGPYFEHEFVDFYNLELSDTNITDHYTYNLLKNEQLEVEIV